MNASIAALPSALPRVLRVAQLARLWLIFFSDAGATPASTMLLRRGYCTVRAATYTPTADIWLFVNPAISVTMPLVLRGAEAEGVLGLWSLEAHEVLRFGSRFERSAASMLAPFTAVEQIKALLGLRSWALTPYGLRNDLMARGAEVVPVPRIGLGAS
jgi:hypothetical protein